MSKFAFVILHYNTIDDTHNCVGSIRRFVKGAEYHIVIVDNCSPNYSGPVLKEEYENSEDITVILNKENLGFARGNNVGFKYAKYELKVDFVVLMNSDTELLDDNFVNIVKEEYKKSIFAVLGPLIKTPKAPYITGPGRSSLIKRSECISTIVLLSLYYLLNFIGLDIWIRKSFSKPFDQKSPPINNDRIENRQLHGSFLVFSLQYISKFDGLCPLTFLYREEELLFLSVMRNGLKTVYLPKLQIFHKGESATGSRFDNDRKKRRFGYKYRILSTIILLKELCR